jgi:hypothetical protein
MPMVIDCPSCNRKLNVPESLLGQMVKCPTCGATFAASNQGPALPPSPPEPSSTPWQAPPEPAAPPSRRDRYDEDDEFPRRRRRHLQAHRGPLILVLGILAVVPIHGWSLSLILGPIAWILGNNDLAEMRAGRMDREGESMTNAGRICGMIATILSIVGLCGCGLFFLIMFAGAAASR